MASEVNKEAFVELQGRLLDTDRKLKQVVAQMRVHEADRKRATLTLQELEQVPDTTNTYKAMGKAFVLEPLDVLRREQEAKAGECTKGLDSLQTSKEYLERQMKEIENNFKELVQQSPALMQHVATVASS